MTNKAKYTNLCLLLCSLIIGSCSGATVEASFQPTGMPLVVTIDSNGEISLNVQESIEYPTPLGTFSVGIVLDPAEYFDVDNTLTVRLNGEDHFYDLHGYDFDLQFEPGYYEQLSLRKTGDNLFLELVTSDVVAFQPTSSPLEQTLVTQPSLSYAEKLCPIAIKQSEVDDLNIGIADPEIVRSKIAIFDSVRAGDAGAFPAGTSIPAGVVVATNFDRQDASKWSQYPVIPIARSGSYGLFQSTGEYVAPDSGACRIIIP